MTFAEQYAAYTDANLKLAHRNVLRGLDTTTSMTEWAQLAGRDDAIRAELERRREAVAA